MTSLVAIGCINGGQDTYNTSYPNVTITEAKGAFVDNLFVVQKHNVTILVTIKSIEPEWMILYANGTVLSYGNSTIVPLTVYGNKIYGEGDNTPINKIENISIAYNETKTIGINLGDLSRGHWNLTISTPTSKTIMGIDVVAMPD